MSIDDLHAKLLDGDIRAIDPLCERLLGGLRAALSKIRLSVDGHVVEGSIDDAIMDYLRAPTRYDPRRGSLIVWLSRCALNRVRDAQRSARRRWNLEVAAGVDITSFPAIPSPDGSRDYERWILHCRRQLFSVARSEGERRFISARLAGMPERAQVAQLGVARVTSTESRREAQRVWDLLRRRLRWHRARRVNSAALTSQTAAMNTSSLRVSSFQS